MSKRTGYDISVLWVVVCLLFGMLILMGAELATQAAEIRDLQDAYPKPGFEEQFDNWAGP